jgi:hypothetical protein
MKQIDIFKNRMLLPNEVFERWDEIIEERNKRVNSLIEQEEMCDRSVDQSTIQNVCRLTCSKAGVGSIESVPISQSPSCISPPHPEQS